LRGGPHRQKNDQKKNKGTQEGIINGWVSRPRVGHLFFRRPWGLGGETMIGEGISLGGGFSGREFIREKNQYDLEQEEVVE